MMKLSTMQAVVATVNEQWESPVADEILLRWDHDAGKAKYWRASTNFVFFFKWLSRDYVLRFNRVDERALGAIAAELDYVNALAPKGIRVAQPIRSRCDQYVERIETSQGAFHAVVFEALPGKQLELEELDAEQIKAWGKALGELHQAATAYNKMGRPSWETYLEMVATHVPTTERGALREMEQLRQALHQRPVTEQTFGLIHYDFEPDNLIWEGTQPGIIDFDDREGFPQ